MAKYRLRVGKKHSHEGKMLEVGAVVELSDSQARNWGDKFELVSGAAPVEPPSPPLTPAKTAGERIAELAKPTTAGEPSEAKKG